MSRKGRPEKEHKGGALGIVLIVLGVLLSLGGVIGLAEVSIAVSALPGLEGGSMYTFPAVMLVAGILLLIGGIWAYD